MSKNIHIVDIETGPRDRESILQFFDPDKIKTGNLKDPQKIADKVAEAETEFVDKAALSAITGEVVCIGIMQPNGKRVFLDATVEGERECLEVFWDMARPVQAYGSSEWAGWNLHGFDMPFIIQRSFFLGLPVPAGIMQGRYFDRRFNDLMVAFTCGVYGAFQSLDTVARFLQIGGKQKDNECTGETAHQFFRSDDPAKREKGFRYLHNDLIMTRRIAERMLGLERLAPEDIGEIPAIDPTTPGPHWNTEGPYPIARAKTINRGLDDGVPIRQA